jgi:hypothetical protein
MIVVLGVAAVTGTAGYVAGRRRRRRDERDKNRAECEGCTHNFAYHDDGGKCTLEVERTLYKGGSRRGKEWVPCGCRQYVGSVPADRLLAAFTRDLPDLNPPSPKPENKKPDTKK